MNVIIQVAIKCILQNKIFSLHMAAKAFWKNLGLFGEPFNPVCIVKYRYKLDLKNNL